MNISELLKQKNCSMYRLAKDTGIPYSAIHDICSGKAKLTNCTAGAVYKIAKRLGVSMEDLILNTMPSTASAEERMDFELFKSHTCHRVKDLGDLDFIAQTLQCKEIDHLYQKKWYPEALYLLAMVDYLCRENDLPICAEYRMLRTQTLAEPIFPRGILLQANLLKNDQIKQQSFDSAIPEFKRFNIVENEVRSLA